MFDYCLKFQIHVVELSKPMTTFALCIIFYLISLNHICDKVTYQLETSLKTSQPGSEKKNEVIRKNDQFHRRNEIWV